MTMLIQKIKELEELYEESPESIDSILEKEEELVNILPELIKLRGIHTRRRLKATSEEDKFDTMISKIMKLLQLKEFDCADGKVSIVQKNKYKVTKEDLPLKYVTYSFAAVDSDIKKGITIPGVEIEFSGAGIKVTV